MTIKLGMNNVRAAQTRGLPIYAETCPQYLNLTWDDLVSILLAVCFLLISLLFSTSYNLTRWSLPGFSPSCPIYPLTLPFRVQQKFHSPTCFENSKMICSPPPPPDTSDRDKLYVYVSPSPLPLNTEHQLAQRPPQRVIHNLLLRPLSIPIRPPTR